MSRKAFTEYINIFYEFNLLFTMAKRFYNNKIVIYWISTGVSPEKIKPFHTNLGPTMTNLTNVIWYEFCLGNVSNDFTKNEQGETFLKVLCMIFWSIIVQLKKKIYLIFMNI